MYGTVDGTRTCKVYSENECVKASDRLIRNVLVANKGVIPSCASNAKGGPKTMEKRTVKYGTSANVNVRKALADVSNVQQNSSTNIRCDGSRIKVSTGSSTKIVSVSLRKSFTVSLGATVRLLGLGPGSHGRVQRKSDVQLDTSKKGTDSRAYLGHQKNDTDVAQSVVTTKERFVRKHVLATRKMIEVLKQQKDKVLSPLRQQKAEELVPNLLIPEANLLTQEANLLIQEANQSLQEAIYGRIELVMALFKFITTKSPCLILIVHFHSIHLGCRVQTNALHTSSRKSTKPLIRTALNASTSQRTLKTTSISGLKKSQSTAAMSAHDELTASSSLPENGSVIVSDDTNQVHLPSNDESNHKTDLSFIPRKKSSRRKSYTTSIIERSKFLKESEVTEQDNLPDIDNECNQLEVSEYIDEIYQYYWVCEVHFKFDLMPETLYLTVTLVDQYLSQVSINKSDMQLVGLTALLLASKYEDFWHPRVKDLISISAQSYTRDQMLGMEKLILRKLKFRLNTPTPYVFMVRFLKAAQSDKKMILKFHKAAGLGKLAVTHEKYSRPELSGVAAVKPLDKLPL
ncbi:hypothetical protein TanjilG_29771 [Lupinus angustifolius]|uniref:B-like cyclin n=1 Tax=Lupinus angustifolius TaxID=3871 RepID=A0A394DD64_LUPAN|nr:hypothetical protein TanjilG_29771 [Lupinus angustifolius]